MGLLLLGVVVLGGTRLNAADLAFRQAVAEAASGNPALATFYRERDYVALWTTRADAARRSACHSCQEALQKKGAMSEAKVSSKGQITVPKGGAATPLPATARRRSCQGSNSWRRDQRSWLSLLPRRL